MTADLRHTELQKPCIFSYHIPTGMASETAKLESVYMHRQSIYENIFRLKTC